ncbi:MAG TPA: DUF1361 domain-containing protein [Patescibacteria group bacterium]
MKISKITQSLILVSIVVIIFDLARLELWGTTDILYLAWNLFLAWIPYIISSFCIKKDTPLKYFIPLFILWLLFFPNAPYLVTDVIHIASRLSPLLWYDSLLFFFFGWIGLLLGMLSLFHIHRYFKAHLSYLISEIIIFIICFISSFGIYLGRFERWNSWDAFISPLHLMKDSFDISTNLNSTKTPLMFVIVFTAFTYAIYKTIYVLVAESL